MQPKHKDWLEIAERDLIAAAKLIKDDDQTLGASVYHTQQCAEKALKAYLAFQEQEIERTHDLVVLINKCCEFDQEFSQFRGVAVELNPFIANSRYPDDHISILFRPAVEQAVLDADSILSFVKNKIGQPQR